MPCRPGKALFRCSLVPEAGARGQLCTFTSDVNILFKQRYVCGTVKIATAIVREGWFARSLLRGYAMGSAASAIMLCNVHIPRRNI